MIDQRSCVVSYDPQTDEQVTAVFIRTAESITPSYLAMRVAQACAQFYALRPGEAVSADGHTYIVAADKGLTCLPATE